MVHGSLWDGNLEVLDSATAIVHGTFYAIGPDGLVVARTQASSPTPPAPSGPGFLGFVTLVAASNVYDVHAFNSSSLAVGDFYSACTVWLLTPTPTPAHPPPPSHNAQRHCPPPPAETSHSCLYAAGDESSPPGVIALHYAKFNLNGAPWGAAVVEGHKGLVSLMGMGGAYSGLNVTVAGSADTHVLMAANALWVNTSTLAISGAAQVSVFADICVDSCLPSQHYFPPRVFPDTMLDATQAVDAIRRLGALAVALNFPWLTQGS